MSNVASLRDSRRVTWGAARRTFSEYNQPRTSYGLFVARPGASSEGLTTGPAENDPVSGVVGVDEI